MKPTAPPYKKAAIILLWLLAWQAASLSVDNSIIMVGPMEVINALWNQAAMPGFWKTIFSSFGKISLGFLLAFWTGILTGGAACRFPLFKDFHKYHGRIYEYRSKAFGNGSDVPHARRKETFLHLPPRPDALPHKRLQGGSGYGMEIRCRRRSDRSS